ncbi:RNA polymerase sigma factor (plasmid) [Streptomyces sp. BI20]|uniref:RNA polymerase sigma factor n=1 Tax=Streptomyces sp. BI20 TaxID=3403460 RepID=UPI003C732C9E
MTEKASRQGRVEGLPPSTLPSEYETFIREHFALLTRVIYLRTLNHHDTEEVWSATLLRIYTKWEKIKSHPNPLALTYRITSDLTTDYMRAKLRRERVESPQEIILDRYQTEPNDYADLSAALETLPKVQRTVVELHYLVGFPRQEVADLLDITISTVNVHLHKARRRLAEVLTSEAPPPDPLH